VIELRTSQPPKEIERHLARLKLGAKMMRTMTMAEVRAVYGDLEEVRDILSQVLDRADGKLR
jgi:hypothetical protein